MKRIVFVVARVAIVLTVAGRVSAANLVVDNFNDGNFSIGTPWTVGATNGGTWSTVGVGGGIMSNISHELELASFSLLNTYQYHPVPHYIETTFPQVSLAAFSLTASVGFYDRFGGSNDDNNALGFAILNAAGTSGYSVEFSRRPLGGWFGMNIRRVDNGQYTETLDLDGRLAAIANGYTRTFDASGNVVTELPELVRPVDNRFDLTFTRAGNDLTFTIAGANLSSATTTLTVSDPNPGGALTNVAKLRAYGTDPGYGYTFDNIVLTDGGPPEPHSATFGRQWLRENPLTVMGAAYGDGNPPETVPFNISQYQGMNLTAVFANKNFAVAEAAADAGVDWHAHFATTPRPYTAYSGTHKAMINDLINRGHGKAWMLPDEPNTDDEILALAESAQWLHDDHPEMLVYITVPEETPSRLNYMIDTIKPDAFMFNNYPFLSNGSTNTNSWFSRLMINRQVGLAHQIPYGGWLQSFHDGISTLRTPSESDTRFNGFTLLTAGYTMLNYFMYDHGAAGTNSTSDLLDQNGNSTALYFHAASANQEYVNLGKSIRYLVSSDVRFVSGGVGSTPTGLTNWTSGAGGDTHILAISINNTNSNVDKDGLIGFFTDDNGQQYFMLTNLYHAAGLSASAASLDFTLTFDNSVNSIWRLSRTTGLAEQILLTNHVLNLTLPGGTGDLFKYDNGNFAGLTAAIPGDFDGDGDVDGADFVAWQTHFPTASGATLAQGDADGDGDVDGADFVVWQTHFPTTPSAGLFVPEPSSLMLATIVWLTLFGNSYPTRVSAVLKSVRK